MKTLTFIFGAALLMSCNKSQLVYDKPYFDFDSLVQKQTELLLIAKVRIEKKTELNGKKDSSSFIPDADQWKYELDAFAQLDAINKPSFENAYQVTDEEDEHSNLKIKKYTAIAKTPVPDFKFYFLGNSLKKIEANYREENLMMTTSRKLTLEFDGGQNKEELIHYFVEGSQKMILSKAVLFSIDGRVNL